MSYISQQIFIRSWWVIAFTLFCTFLYEQGISKKNQQFQYLSEQLASLRQEKFKALHRQADLQRQINSQSDLAWIEFTLMKGLGMCPEDQKKVYFFKPNEEDSF